MAIPKKYQKTGEAAIASYDFADIATGKASQTFYGGIAVVSGAPTAIMSDNTFYSNFTSTGHNLAANGLTLVYQKNFDIDVNRTFTVDGKSVLSLPIGMNSEYSSLNMNMMASAEVFRIRQGTTTELCVSGTTGFFRRTSMAAGDYHSRNAAIYLNLDRTTLVPNDTLRLRIKVFGDCETAQKGHFGFGHDPQNRNESVDTVSGGYQIIEDAHDTKMEWMVPIRILT